MNRLFTHLLAASALVAMSGSVASAQVPVPNAFGMQGYIHTQGGAPYEGAASIEVRLYDEETAGTLLYTETIADVPVTGSRFSVEVGAAGPSRPGPTPA